MDDSKKNTCCNLICFSEKLQFEYRIKELEERQKWIDEVGRPGHPDDERPWASAYLDCRARIKELEEKLKLRESILCPECFQTLEPDGSCFTCRVVKRVKELEEEKQEAYQKGYDEGIKDGLAH